MQVGAISDAGSASNKSNCIKVGREKGYALYVADSETEMVEWISALDSTVTKLMKIIAGVDDEAPRERERSRRSGGGGGGGGGGSSHAAFLQQAERDYASSRPSAPQRNGAYAGASGYGKPSGGGRSGYGDYGDTSYPATANYPGIQAPKIDHAPDSRHIYGASGAGGGGGGVYQDEYGVSYGLGTGTSIGGIAGIAGVRTASGHNAGPSGHSGSAHGGGGGRGGAPLPATLNISDPYGDQQSGEAGAGSSRQHGAPPQPQYGGAPGYGAGGFGGGGGGGGYQDQAASLPDTLNVMSIIDQPPAQRSSYGIGSAHAGYGAPAQQQQQQQPPPQQQQAASHPQPQHAAPQQFAPQQLQAGYGAPQAQWQTHYTAEGRPYYFDPASGQTSWDPPR